MRTIGRLILTAVTLLLTAALAAAAIYMPEQFFSFYTGFSKNTLAFLSELTGAFPFAVWEVLLVLIVLLALYFLVQDLSRKRGILCWLAGAALLISVMVFAFVGLWGLNHFAPSVADRVGLEVTAYSKEQLTRTAAYMAQQASTWAEQVERDQDGNLTLNFSQLAQDAVNGYDVLAQDDDFFSGSHAPVKKLLAGKVFSYMGTTGIFVAFTGESSVNPDTYCASVPFTMCHELAHRLTVAPENEANFCAFLACQANPDPIFQYSGWYSAFVYTYNALYKADRSAAEQVWNQASETLQAECRRANAHYEPYDGQVREAAQKANDVYLKAFREENGVQSYGEVADLLIAWYLKNAA